MTTGNFYRGTSATQDSRFSNKDKKLLKQFIWPPEYSQKVDIKKVNLYYNSILFNLFIKKRHTSLYQNSILLVFVTCNNLSL